MVSCAPVATDRVVFDTLMPNSAAAPTCTVASCDDERKSARIVLEPASNADTGTSTVKCPGGTTAVLLTLAIVGAEETMVIVCGEAEARSSRHCNVPP